MSQSNNLLVLLLCQSLLQFKLTDAFLFDADVPRPVVQEVHAGYYDVFYPGYHHNNPAPDHYKGPVPFGLPLGGIAQNGQPYGMMAYLMRGYRLRGRHRRRGPLPG